jgi:DNA repair protein RecO
MLKTRAIVLGQKDFRNHDALVSFYSLDFGKITLIARGLRKSSSKLAGQLDVFNLVDLMIIKGRERDYVGSAISENSFLGIKENYDKIILAGKGFRFLNGLTFERQPDYNIFLLLRNFLYFLDKVELGEILEAPSIALYFFKLKLLEFLGYDFSSLKGDENEPGLLLSFTRINPEILSLKDKIISLDLDDSSSWRDIKISSAEIKKIDNFIEIIKEIIY